MVGKKAVTQLLIRAARRKDAHTYTVSLGALRRVKLGPDPKMEPGLVQAATNDIQSAVPAPAKPIAGTRSSRPGKEGEGIPY